MVKTLPPQIEVHIQRGTQENPHFETYTIDVTEGMVVLDVVHKIQAEQAPDLAVRWNCKAGKCGSCGAEVNGYPRLMCMTKLTDLDLNKPLVITPMKTFPIIKDLVTDVSWNFEVHKAIPPYKHPEGLDDVRMMQEDVNRIQEFRKCIQCFLCQNTCHVLRQHQQFNTFAGPAFMLKLANLEMHPLDQEDRIPLIKEKFGVELCNITKCCTEVCPEEIPITDEAIIALKERVADRYYDPLRWLARKIIPKKK